MISGLVKMRDYAARSHLGSLLWLANYGEKNERAIFVSHGSF
jgi:hypothetical protein